MVREIKVRVYDKDLAKYLEGCEIDSLMAELSADGDGRAVIIKQICPARYIFEQYTGLEDKNGEEICEGDIVLDYYDGDDAFIVEWDKDTASFILTGTDNIASVSFDNFYSDKDLEIIGNIHENPELLKPWNAAELEGNR